MTNKELERIIREALTPVVNTVASLQLQLASLQGQSDPVTTHGDCDCDWDDIPAVPTRKVSRKTQTQTRPVAASAPKQTSPKQTRKSDPAKEASPRPSIKRVIDPTDFELAVEQARDIVIRNTRNKRNMPFNEKMTVLIDNDPRPFLGKDAWQFRKAYKTAGISYRDAAIALAESLDDAGWSYPS